MIVIGITGGTGAGKTTLLSAVEQRGGLSIDCDALYYELLKTDRALREQITAAFGTVFFPDGSLDRKTLGEKIYHDEKSRRTLNEIVYRVMKKAVREKLDAAARENVPLAAIDAINLLQSGLADFCDLTVAVIADEDTRRARIIKRDGISEAYATSRIVAQEKDRFFTENCTKTLKNFVETEEKFRKICADFLDTIEKEYKK